MNTEYYFRVAGFPFRLCLPGQVDVESLLPSFRPFRCGPPVGEPLLFTLHTLVQPPAYSRERAVLLDEMTSDMGFTRLWQTEDAYRIEVSRRPQSPVHCLRADRQFSSIGAFLHWEDPFAGASLCSLVRMAFAQAVLFRQAVSIHASVVVHDGRACLFMGKSGTGKSTHASLWLKHIPGSRLLNDDNPVIRLEEGRPVAYGTPWSGKTPCYINRKAPVQGMVRLRQAGANRFFPQTDAEAFMAMLPGCSAIRQDADLYNALCDTLVEWAERVRVGVLECLPDAEAARLCRDRLYEE